MSSHATIFLQKNLFIHSIYLLESLNQYPLKCLYFATVILSPNTIYLSSSQDCHFFILIVEAHILTIYINKFFIKNIIFFSFQT